MVLRRYHEACVIASGEISEILRTTPSKQGPTFLNSVLKLRLRWTATRVALALRCRVILAVAEIGKRQGTMETWFQFEILKISGNGRGTFQVPSPTRFLGRLGG